MKESASRKKRIHLTWQLALHYSYLYLNFKYTSKISLLSISSYQSESSTFLSSYHMVRTIFYVMLIPYFILIISTIFITYELEYTVYFVILSLHIDIKRLSIEWFMIYYFKYSPSFINISLRVTVFICCFFGCTSGRELYNI